MFWNTLVQGWFGRGVPRVFSITWRASTKAAPEAGVSLQDTAVLWREGKSDVPLFLSMQEQGDTTVMD